MSAAEQPTRTPSHAPADQAVFDLARLSERDVAAEIERRVAAFRLARAESPAAPGPAAPPHPAPTGAAATSLAPTSPAPTSLAPTSLAPPDPAARAEPEPAGPSPALGLVPGAPPIDKVMAMCRRRTAPSRLALDTVEDARGYSPGFVAVLAGQEKVGLDLGARRPKAAPRRAPRDFRSGFLAGVITAATLAVAAVIFWRPAGDDAAPVAAGDASPAPPTLAARDVADAPAADMSAADAPAADALAFPPGATRPPASGLSSSGLSSSDQARRGGPGHFAAAPFASAPAIPPPAAAGPEIRTAATAARVDGPVRDDGAMPALAPVLKPPVPPREAAAAAPKAAAATPRAPHDDPFAPLFDFLAPVTGQIDRDGPGNPPRPENQGKRGD